ncbi:MAG: alkaline phosphatase family protein [Roseiflexaceae bacterium]
MVRTPRWTLALILLTAMLVSIGTPALAQPANPINHIVVIYLENHSFDNLYGMFPGANGIANAGATATQVDKNGTPYATLPQPINSNVKPPAPDSRFPADLPNKPFNIDQYVPLSEKTGDLVHRFYQEQLQMDGGKMDKFVAWTDAAGLVMGYYDTAKLPLYKYAREYTLADNFFHGAFGGSFLNHIWLVCACTPTWPNAPAAMKAQLDANGILVKDGAVTPDGYAVNTSFTIYSPHPANITDTLRLVPPQTKLTIGDGLSAKGISWAWYSGGWNDALSGHPDPLFQFHHQPFAYFQNYGDGTDGRKQHLKDESDFYAAIQDNTLPAVAFVKPLGAENEHPGYAVPGEGEMHVAQMIDLIQKSPAWKETAIIVTYDENGGFWDHVAPPKMDQWGPGSRVPALIISPYAKRGYVDHTVMDTTSILALIENRYGLAPLGTREGQAGNMLSAFDFSQNPNQPAAPAGGPSTLPRTGGDAAPLSLLALALALLIALGAILRRLAWLSHKR